MKGVVEPEGRRESGERKGKLPRRRWSLEAEGTVARGKRSGFTPRRWEAGLALQGAVEGSEDLSSPSDRAWMVTAVSESTALGRGSGRTMAAR